MYLYYITKMPSRYRAHTKRGGMRGGMRGGSFKSFLKKASKFLRKTRLISRLGSALGSVGVPYVGAVGKAAGALGYGRKRRYYRRKRRTRARTVRSGRGRRGGALRLAGMRGRGLSIPGGRRRRKRRGLPKERAMTYF